MSDKVVWSNVRHFRASEVACPCGCGRNEVAPELMAMLDGLRDRLGLPIRINSAYRCPAHNEAVGGEPGSVHTHGLAADIHIPDGAYRMRVLRLLMDVGVRRIGIYPGFVHADVAGLSGAVGPWPLDVIWVGK